MKINKSIVLISLIFFIYSVLSGLAIGYLLFFYGLIVMFSMYLLVVRAEKNIDVFIYISDQETTVGEKIAIEYKIINLGVLPMPRVKIRLKVSKKLSDIFLHEKKTYLGTYDHYALKNELVLKRRGIFSIGKLEIELADYFNLFHQTLSIDKKIHLKVYPKLIDIDPVDMVPQEFFGHLKVNQVAYEDFTSVNRVRPLLPGDSKKRIHWKISSKYDEFYTKIFDLTADATVQILLNTYKKDFKNDLNGRQEEQMISYCLSVVKYCLDHKIKTTLVSMAPRKREIVGSSIKDYDHFLQHLTLVETESEIPLIKLLEDHEKKKINSTLLLITSVADELLKKKIEIMRHNNVQIHLIETGRDLHDFKR